MNPNPIRRSPSPLAPPQQPAQFIYATPSPTTTSPYAASQLPGGSPFMASTNGGSEMTAGADGRPLYLCQPFIRAALVTGKFKNIVVLPKYVDVNEWVAINMFDFYTNLNLFLSVFSECCTQASCPTMSAAPGVDYTWVDNNRRQLRLAAPTYIDFVTTWIQNALDDPVLFPTKFGKKRIHSEDFYEEALTALPNFVHSP
ncbi:Maintenance of ploidy protein mob2 [Tulasnella sp. UAMH 9824]|nr:Maintenance of ploidy protein mob2 [Tulasnella sp. UAMH 9824]